MILLKNLAISASVTLAFVQWIVKWLLAYIEGSKECKSDGMVDLAVFGFRKVSLLKMCWLEKKAWMKPSVSPPLRIQWMACMSFLTRGSITARKRSSFQHNKGGWEPSYWLISFVDRTCFVTSRPTTNGESGIACEVNRCYVELFHLYNHIKYY